MRVFVTGATGWVGSAVTQELLAAGHAVLGLARSESGAAALASKGAEPLRGALDDHDALRRGAAGADAVIHTAFHHDFERFADACALDRRAILALGAALEGTDRPMLVTSGVAMLAAGRVATEADMPPDDPAVFPRRSEFAAAELAARGVRVATVRLAPSVHGAGDRGFVPILIDIARRSGMSAYVGDGSNLWPGVHRLDAARLYRLALEQGGAGGPFHAVADEGVSFRALAELIARRLDVPATSLPPDRVAAHFGWFGMFVGLGMAASSARTQARLGWAPTQAGLLEDVERAYFPA